MEKKGIDRRRHYRLRISMAIRVEAVDAASHPFTEDTHTINVSLEGASFLSKKRLEVGQLVTLSVMHKCRVQARVAWISDLHSDGWREIGVQLLPPIQNWVIQ